MMTTAQATPLDFDEMVAAISNATTEVFSVMLGMDLEKGAAYTERCAGTESGILALVGVAGPWMGTGSISCTPQLACKVAGQMLMSEYDSVNDEVLDAIAEVANMIIGNIKTALEQVAGAMALSTPTVIYGRNFETRRVGSQEWVSVPFACGTEIVHVQLCLAPARDESRALRPGFALPHTVQM